MIGGREWKEVYLPAAFEEGRALIEPAAKRKGLYVNQIKILY